MSDIAVLKTTSDVNFTENVLSVNEMNLKLSCINVPYRRKMKRKDKAKLLSKLNSFDKIFTSETCLRVYEKGVCNKSFIDFFLVEFLKYLQKNVVTEKIGVLCDETSENATDILTVLSKEYRVIYLFSDNADIMSFVQNILEPSGVPLYAKTVSDISKHDFRYIIRIDHELSVCDVLLNKEYSDLEIEFLYPLTKYCDLPLDKIIKTALELKKCCVNEVRRMVKIVGKISK